MANEEKLEDIAKTAPVNTEAKNSDSSENLEGKVKRGLGSRLWGFTKVAGTTGIAAAIGDIGAAATIGGYMAADLLFRKKEFKKDAPKRTAETLHQANFATGINKGYFAVTNSIDSVIGKGGAGLALITPYNLLFIPVAYAIEKYKFGGFIKNMALHPFRTMKDIYDNTYSANTYGSATSSPTYTPPKTYGYNASRMFWADKNGRIYRWSWKGL